ncbi:polysaccharide biosynthesis protein [Plastorhodobacter daqingensis]|uniref:Polysaccharide biosynthesis protein n=1 Tax=Plastorhodobacter daqingensis TaxID=1387281 RepID=A0ABW2UE02_9RHOB
MSRLGVMLFHLSEALSRPRKRLVLLSLDVALVPLALGAAALVSEPELSGMRALWGILILGAAAGLLSVRLGIHAVKLNAYETSAIIRTALLALLLGVLAFALARQAGVQRPLAGVVVFAVFYFVLSVGLRFAMLHLLLWACRAGQNRRAVLIYGAGSTGMQLAAALRTHHTIVPVGFIDDNPALDGLTVAGLRVWPSESLPDIVRKHAVRRVLLAMPSAPPARHMQILNRLRGMSLEVLALPSFAQLVGEEELMERLKPVAPGDFLGRRQLEQELRRGDEAYRGRTILVTGAGGSIGSELCRQLLHCAPARIILFEVSEIALYTIEQELRDKIGRRGIEIVPVLGTVMDSRLVRMVMAGHKVQVVFHAAAYKHVPLVEANPVAGLANNVLGTRVLAEAAHEAGVDSFIFVSTDKAVRPTNVMGASKRLAELVVQDLARRSRHTVFSMVRFGNVLGSSGSVIPLFQSQIARGGPVTLTHEEVTRYFMTIGEAARLVILSGAFSAQDQGGSRGGDVFVLDMGEPIRIRDLARQMIEAAGYRVRGPDQPDGDIEIVTIGLRPGEKLHEELLIGEGLLTTPHPKILRAQEEGLSELEIAAALRSLRDAVALGDADAACGVIRRWVRGYEPAVPGAGSEVPSAASGAEPGQRAQ